MCRRLPFALVHPPGEVGRVELDDGQTQTQRTQARLPLRGMPTPPPPAMTTALQLHAELVGEERAIRHLVGEQKALTSELARERALEKLTQARLHAATTTRNHPAVGAGGALPHGDRFPDVSEFQPNVDWGAVRRAASVRVGELAFTKLTEGTSWVDPFGQLRLREMAAQHFAHRGGYHFHHPADSPIEQAHHFLNGGGAELGPADIACCDSEVSDGQPAPLVAAGVREFAGELRKHTPAKLWLYTGGPFAQEFGITLNGYDAHWLAAYVGNPFPFMVFGRARTIAWQYTDGRLGPVPHVCPGIGAGDLSIIL